MNEEKDKKEDSTEEEAEETTENIGDPEGGATGQQSTGVTWSNITGGATLNGRITLNGNIPSVPSSAIAILNFLGNEISNWTIVSTKVSGSDFDHDIVATPPENTVGNFRLRAKQESIQITNIFSVPSANTDTALTRVYNSGIGLEVRGGTQLSVTILSGINTGVLAGIEASDFEVIGFDGSVQSGWSFTSFTPPSTMPGLDSYTGTISPPSGTLGQFRVRLKANSITWNQVTGPYPTEPLISNTANVDSMGVLTSGTSWTPTRTNGFGIAGYDGKIYVSSRTGTAFTIRQYMPNGTYISGSDITGTIRNPRGSVGTITAVRSFDIYNNKIYINISWNNAVNYIQRYSISGVWESDILVDISSTPFLDMAIDNGQMFLKRRHRIWTYNLEPSIERIGNNPISGTGSTGAITATSNEIILTNNTQIIVLNRSTYSQKSARTTSISGVAGDNLTVLNKTLYYDNNTTITPYSSVTDLADWGSISVDNNNVFSASIFFHTSISGLDGSDIEIQMRSGTLGSYIWATSTGWTITPTGSGNIRTITASPPSTVSDGFYRLSLKTNSLNLGNPRSFILSDSAEVEDRREVITASWTIPTNADNNRLLGSTVDLTLTFNLAVPASELSATDFSFGGDSSSISSISPPNGSQTEYTVTVTHPVNSTGFYTISLNTDSIPSSTTYLEGPDPAVSTANIYYDSRSRLAISSFAAPANTAQTPLTGETIDITLAFDNDVPVSDLTADDFSITTGSIDSIEPAVDMATNEDTYTITVRQPTNSSGTYTLTLRRDAIPRGISYARGPASSSQVTVNFDTRAVLTIQDFDLITPGTQTGTDTSLELEFPISIPTAQLDSTDFTVDGGATFKSVTGQDISFGLTDTYGVLVTNPLTSTGSYNITIRENAVAASTSYLAGPLANDPERTVTVSYDTRAVVTVNTFTAPMGTQTGASSVLRLTFNQEVLKAQVTITDFSVISGTVASVASVNTDIAVLSDDEYDITITNPIDHRGSLIVTLAADAVPNGTSYLEGPANPFASDSVSYDTRSAIRVTAFDAPGTSQTGLTSRLDLQLSSAVPTGQISSADFTLATGTSISSIVPQNVSAGSASLYWIYVSNPSTASGTYTIDLKANSIAETDTYKSGPENVETSDQVTYDTRAALTATFTDLTTTQESSTSSIILTLNQTVPATELSVSDFSVSVTTASVTSVTAATTNASVYTVIVTHPTDHRGSYDLTLSANAISAGTSYLSGPIAAESTTITYDTRSAISVTDFDAPSGVQGTTSTFTLELDNAIPPTQLSADDFIVPATTSVASITPNSGANVSTFMITVNNPTQSSGSYTISLEANSIDETDTYKSGPSADHASTSTTYDTIAFTATWSGEIFENGKLSASISFSHDVDGILSSDFEVLDTSDTVQSWPFDPLATSIDVDNSLTVAVTPPADTNGTFRFRLKEDSLQYNNLGTDNGPEANTDSLGVEVDNRPQLSIDSFESTVSGTIESANTVIRITFNEEIPKTELVPYNTADFTASAGTITSVASVDTTSALNDDQFDITVRNPVDSTGSLTVTMGANRVAEATTYKSGPLATDPNIESETVNYDTREVITATLSITGGTQTSATTEVTLTLNKSVPNTQISLSDFSSTQTLSNLQPTSGSSMTYTLDSSNPDNAHGSYNIIFRMNSVDNSTTYKQGPATDSTLTINYDRRDAVTVISFPDAGTSSNRQTGATTTIRLTLSHEVTVSEITTADFSITSGSGTVTSVGPATTGSTSDNEFDLVLTNPTTSRGDYTVAFRIDAVPDGDSYKEGPATASSADVYFDTRTIVQVSSFTGPLTLQTGSTTNLSLVLNVSVTSTEIAASDFAVTSGSATIGTPTGTGTTYTIPITNRDNHRGSYTIRFNMNAVSDGTTYRQGPATASSVTISYDRRSAISISSFADVGSAGTPQTGATSQLTLTLSQAVAAGQIAIADFTPQPSSVTTTDNQNFQITVANPADRRGSQTITLAANAVAESDTYKSGPAESEDRSAIVYYDRRVAIAVESFTVSGTGSSSTVTLRLNRTVPATQVSAADFNPRARVSDIEPDSGSASTYTITTSNPDRSTGSYVLTFNANSIPESNTYRAGPATASTVTIAYDTRIALLVTDFDAPLNTTTGSSTFDLTFNTAIDATELTSTDFTTSIAGTGAITVSPSTGTASSFDITVINPSTGTGTYYLTLAADSIPAGTAHLEGPDTAQNSSAVSYDPRAALTAQFGTWANNVIRLTFSAAIPVTQLTANDFLITTGSLSIRAITSTNSTQFDITVTNPERSSGRNRVTLIANSIDASTTYQRGPIANVQSPEFTFDTRQVVTASWMEPSGLQTENTATLTLTISELIPRGELSTSDFTVTMGSIDAVRPQGAGATVNQFNVIVDQPDDLSGSYTVTLNSGAISGTTTYLAQDQAYTSQSISFDTRTAVSVESFTAPSMDQITARTTLTLTFDRSVPISQLTNADFTFTTGGPSIQTISAGVGNAFMIIVNNPTGQGTYQVKIRMNAIVQTSSTPYLSGPEDEFTSETVTYDRRSRTPTFSLVSSLGGSQDTSTARLVCNVSFSGASGSRVLDLFSEDFEVVAQGTPTINPLSWSISAPSYPYIDPGDVLIITATPSGRTNGTFALRLKANSVRFRLDSRTDEINAPSTAQTSNYITVRRTVQAIIVPTVATARWDNVSGGSSLSGNIIFEGASVTGIGPEDFDVYQGSSRQTGWRITVSTASVSDGQFSLINAQPPAMTNGSYSLRLKRLSVMSDGSTSDNAPASNVNSTAYPVNSDLSEDKYTLRIPLPANSEGAIHISVKSREFYVTGNPSQLGPMTKQYLGTIYYDNLPPFPFIEDVLLPDRLTPDSTGHTDDNAILVKFTVPVKGVSVAAFRLEGMPTVTISNNRIYYSTTDIAATDSGWREGDDATIADQRERYWKIRPLVPAIPGSDPPTAPRGILNIFVRDNVINNDN